MDNGRRCLLRFGGITFRPSWRKADDLAIVGKIAPSGVFYDRIKVIIELRR